MKVGDIVPDPLGLGRELVVVAVSEAVRGEFAWVARTPDGTYVAWTTKQK